MGGRLEQRLVICLDFPVAHSLADSLSHTLGVVGGLLLHGNLAFCDEDSALEDHAVLGTFLSDVQLGLGLIEDIAFHAVVAACRGAAYGYGHILADCAVIALDSEFLDYVLDSYRVLDELFV